MMSPIPKAEQLLLVGLQEEQVVDQKSIPPMLPDMRIVLIKAAIQYQLSQALIAIATLRVCPLHHLDVHAMDQ